MRSEQYWLSIELKGRDIFVDGKLGVDDTCLGIIRTIRCANRNLLHEDCNRAFCRLRRQISEEMDWLLRTGKLCEFEETHLPDGVYKVALRVWEES